ncbi:Yip1_domain-containing protein [Hexamita inflata]|uniref:Yip1 domain-containing protein n=1 Tax=Hexamita inflata TaxID=28002 RepID=A0AA86VEL7_9EUKA|nr:Yip1 domain-containing protein [Hexamita inflata]CAI9964423.1 Yip1 domain-containing protein [Hexamita inflata]
MSSEFIKNGFPGSCVWSVKYQQNITIKYQNSQTMFKSSINNHQLCFQLSLVPALLGAICWCMDMEDISYMVLLDLIVYSMTILIPIFIFYPISSIITTAKVMRTVAIIIYSVCAAWSQIFIVYHGLRYVRTFKGTKGMIVGISLAIILLHAAFLVTIGCLMFVIKT